MGWSGRNSPVRASRKRAGVAGGEKSVNPSVAPPATKLVAM